MDSDLVCTLTLGIEKVADWDRMTLVNVNRGIFEHLVFVSLRPYAHILLAKRLSVRVDVCILLVRSQLWILANLVASSCHYDKSTECNLAQDVCSK